MHSKMGSYVRTVLFPSKACLVLLPGKGKQATHHLDVCRSKNGPLESPGKPVPSFAFSICKEVHRCPCHSALPQRMKETGRCKSFHSPEGRSKSSPCRSACHRSLLLLACPLLRAKTDRHVPVRSKLDALCLGLSSARGVCCRMWLARVARHLEEGFPRGLCSKATS